MPVARGRRYLGAVVKFTVAGIPRQQGSKKAYVVKGRAVIVDDNKAPLKEWRSMVAGSARIARKGTTLEGPVKVAAAFVMPRGKSVTREWPSTVPDLDKLTRALLDALTIGGIYGDDRQVVHLDVIETYGDPAGVVVVVSPIGKHALAMWRARNER